MNENKRPNIVVIMFDHQLYYGHGSGKNSVLRPCFEDFEKSATVFDNAFSCSPLCGPARRSMLNGLYPHKHGQLRNGMTEITERTYFDCLTESGYDSYYFGKFHAGKGTAQMLGNQGFSPEGYSSPYVLDDYKEYLRERQLPSPQGRVEFSETERQYFREGEEVALDGFPFLYTYTFGELTTSEDTHECFYLANRVCKTLERLSDADRPFSIRVDFWGPHHPYFPSDKFLDMYDLEDIDVYPSFYDDLKDKPPVYAFEHAYNLAKDNRIIYPNPQSEINWKKMLRYAYAQNTMCDAAAGRIIEKLKALGLYDNTVVIWSADHGDALCSHGGHIDKNSYLSEEVLRVPLAVHVPGAFPKRSDAFVTNMDIPITVADYACGGFGASTDGISLRPLISGAGNGRDYFVVETHGHFQTHFARAVCKGDYRYIYNRDMTDELYDLRNDPYQMRNLCSDPGYAEIKQNLIECLNRWRAEYRDTE